MSTEYNGELVPVGGGDPIPLVRQRMSIGRRASCDICLQFPNISGMHCEVFFRDGYWVVRDLGSTNGVKVNGQRVLHRPLRPGDEIAIAKRRFTIQYNLALGGQQALEDILSEGEDITSQSLLEKAGLEKRRSRTDDDDDDL
jgi:pSer/pThr/pTyr-binding forkhead associated (FHA) protein